MANGNGKPYKVNCPICGHKPDGYCWYSTTDAGFVLSYCARETVPKGTEFLGKDNVTYKALGPAGNGEYYKYQELAQYKEYLKKFCGIEYKNRTNYNSGVKSAAWKEAESTMGYKEVGNWNTVAPTSDLNRFYGSLLDRLALEPKDEASLREEWTDKVFDEITKYYPIKTLPVNDWTRRKAQIRYEASPLRKRVLSDMQCAKIPMENIPGLYDVELDSTKYPGKKFIIKELDNKGGVLFPVYNSKGEICRVRLKDQTAAVDGEMAGEEGRFNYRNGEWFFKKDSEKNKPGFGEKVYSKAENISKVRMLSDGLIIPRPCGDVNGKYKNFSSFAERKDHEKKEIHNRYLNGTRSGSPISLYCKAPDTNFSVVFCTEGEKKGMVTNVFSRFPCLVVPGVNNTAAIFNPEEGMDTSMWDALVQKGMKLFVVAFDADKNENKSVLRAEKTLIENAFKHGQKDGVQIAVADWMLEFAKGIDDLYVNGGRPSFSFVTSI